MDTLEAIRTRRSVRQYLDKPVPNSVIPHSLVPLGYPAEQPPQEERYRADRIHRDGW